MPNSRLTLDNAATYEICVQGCLAENWSDYIGAASIRVQDQLDGSPVTVLTGEFQDQAALAGALTFLYDLGLPLLSVAYIGVAPNNRASSGAIDALEDGGC